MRSGQNIDTHLCKAMHVFTLIRAKPWCVTPVAVSNYVVEKNNIPMKFHAIPNFGKIMIIQAP